MPSKILQRSIQQWHLLNHPFYIAWNEGTLDKTRLQFYAVQYFDHVSMFPRFINNILAHCEAQEDRHLLLMNLLDEEGYPNEKPHPKLWLQFINGLGISKTQVPKFSRSKAAKNLVQVFWNLTRSSFEEGLGALYAYEYQIPEVAKVKIEGLKCHFNISSSETLEFFKVHEKADVYHREALEKIINKFGKQQNQKAIQAARKASKVLWDFLSEMHEIPAELKVA